MGDQGFNVSRARAESCAACTSASCPGTAPARPGPTPYEIHVTVAEADVDGFRATAEAAGAKPVLLALQLAGGGSARDVMTSSVHLGDDASAFAEARRVSDALSGSGLVVTRVKVETAPWHPLAPSAPGEVPPPGRYFESHIAVRCPEGRREELSAASLGLGLHLSRNAFKADDGRGAVVMATARCRRSSAPEFSARAEAARDELARRGFRPEKLIVEYTLLDTRESLDDAWTGRAA